MKYTKNNSNCKYAEKNKLTISRFLSFKDKYTSDDEEINEFYKVINEDEAKFNVDLLKWKLIPNDLKSEVENLVARNYAGNRKRYFDDVQIYFDTFTIQDLYSANLTDEKIKIKEARINKLAGEVAQTVGMAGGANKALRRKLATKRNNVLWHASALLKLIGKGNASYCSNTIFNEFKRKKVRDQEFIKNSVIVGTDKKVIPLAKATKTAEQSIAEKINLLKTVEKIAENKGFSWCFITLTLDGEYHPNPCKGKNTYNGVSPKESAKLINKKINNVRAYLKKMGVVPGADYLGCATAEAHKDGCMHKHIMFFTSRENFELVRKAFFKHFPNLNKRSFVFESKKNLELPKMKEDDVYEDGKFKMTPSSYVLKYVMKSVNYFDKDMNIMSIKKEDDEALYNAMLNNAFRSYNNIRGFSFFGIENCLTKFRFIARNYKNMDLPVEFNEMIKDNNLYEMMKQGFLEFFKNIYVQINENSQFVGCKFNGQKYMKRFFSLVRNALEIKEEEINLCSEAAEMKKNKVMVLVNPNYSREPQILPKTNPFTLFFNVSGTEFEIPGIHT